MSIVEWLPDLPADWDVARLSYLCRIGTGELDTIDADPEGSVPFYIRSPHIQRATSATGAGEAVLTPGDGAVGEVFHHHRVGDFAAHQRVYVLDRFDRTKLLPRFFYWYFSSRFRMVTSGGTAKSTVESLRRPMFTSFPVALPPLVQQRRIADYLDRESATIDALIEKQMSLIAGLIERRRATISKSVVTGLHGSAVRCTGDTYFPRIADTWQLQPLGYGYDVVLGKMLDAKRASQDGDTELPYVRAANIKDGYLDLEDVNSMAYTPYEVMRLDLRAGDLGQVPGSGVTVFEA